jgi:PhoH-like ATPase
MRKTYVFDTSALIDDPNAWKQYPHCDLVIPMTVLEELDDLKKQAGQTGRNARVSIRFLDKLSDSGDINTGILLENDSLIRIDANYIDITDGRYGAPDYGDSKIIACLVATNEAHPEKDVTLVSNDFALRTKAKARSIDAVSHSVSGGTFDDLYSGVQIVEDEEIGMELQRNSTIDPRCFGLKLNPNECVLFQDQFGEGICLGRKVAPDKLKLVRKQYPWQIQAKNKEQSFAMDLITDKSVDLVTLIGKAGTGKSLIVLACALELVISKKEYDKFIIYRPIQSVGNDIGYLPGTMEEKLAPWFQAIMDNFELLFTNKVGGDWKRDLEMFQKKGRIEMEAMTYIRGRSIPNAIILVDECQNITKEDVKTILTRAGENTKIILTGDIEQIDNSGLDATNNGLTHVIEKFKDCDFAGHITFTQGERSKLATKAAEIL